MSEFGDLWVNGELLAERQEAVPSTITRDKFGISAGKLQYLCAWDAVDRCIRELDTHPDYPWLTLESAVGTREDALLARIDADYRGIDPSAGEKAVYGLEESTSSEPIETHPNFVANSGQWVDPTLWLNGAKFVLTGPERGKFLGFIPDDPGLVNPKYGVKNWLAGGCIYTETKTYGSDALAAARIDLSRLGKIDEPPDSPFLPVIGEHENWLLITASADQVGTGLKVVKKWRKSGPKGWDPAWYR